MARIEGEPATDVLVREPMSLQLRGSVAVAPGGSPRDTVPLPRTPG